MLRKYAKPGDQWWIPKGEIAPQNGVRGVRTGEVQKFVGALSGRADGGLLTTTSRFTASALNYAETIPTRIILIDGNQLANLMIRYEVGVEIKQTYNVVAIDEDFFV